MVVVKIGNLRRSTLAKENEQKNRTRVSMRMGPFFVGRFSNSSENFFGSNLYGRPENENFLEKKILILTVKVWYFEACNQ